MNSTIEHKRTPMPSHRKRYAPSIAALERTRRRLDGHVRGLSRRMEKYDVRLKAIEFKLNFIWAVTVMLLALALGVVGQSVVKG